MGRPDLKLHPREAGLHATKAGVLMGASVWFSDVWAGSGHDPAGAEAGRLARATTRARTRP
jgi:hypothetical protein